MFGRSGASSRIDKEYRKLESFLYEYEQIEWTVSEVRRKVSRADDEYLENELAGLTDRLSSFIKKFPLKEFNKITGVQHNEVESDDDIVALG